MIPSVVATLATKDARADLFLFLRTLGLWNLAAPTVYLYCDSEIQAEVTKWGYPGLLRTRAALDPYTGKGRQELEQTRGITYPSMWFEFMAEKMNLLDWAFETVEPDQGILFCDADICFTGPLPKIPDEAIVALSPHKIRQADEAKFGRYNGGFFWFSDPVFVQVWREACQKGTRFFEQAALEDIAYSVEEAKPDGGLYKFPITENYGWWRLWQTDRNPADVQRDWTMLPGTSSKGCGLLVQGQPLGSIHTHFTDKTNGAIAAFNQFILEWLQRVAQYHPPAAALLSAIAQI
jgi:hypothetical protein